MPYQMTPWGYEVSGYPPPLIDLDAFNALTGGKWDDDARVESMLDAASAAVRNYCGWHIVPNIACRATIDTDAPTRSLWVPTTCMTSLDSITVGDGEIEAEWSRIGQIRTHAYVPRGLQAATVEYHAGLNAVPPDLAAVVAGVIVHAVALSYGVTSESAGGVSVSYASGAAYGGAAMASLTDADRAALVPYVAVMAHAT